MADVEGAAVLMADVVVKAVDAVVKAADVVDAAEAVAKMAVVLTKPTSNDVAGDPKVWRFQLRIFLLYR